MAEAVRNRLPSGYEEEFVNAPDDEILCLICHLPQKGPVLTACGHRFCKDCLEEHFRRQEERPLTCPADRQTLIRDKDIFADKATERKILSLIIKCPSDGCEWTGELRYKEDHIQKTCKLCPMPCPYKCGALILRKQELQDHLETCEHFPVKCPNNCEAVISREMVQNHIDDNCPLTKIPCPYVRMGCRNEVQRNQLELHLQLETASHLDLTCSELNDIQEKLQEKTIQLDGLEERVEVIQQQHQSKVNILQKQLEQKVNTTQTKLEQTLKRERKILFVCLFLSFVCLMLYLEEVQRQHKKSVSVVEKNLEGKVDSLNADLRLTEESRMFTWKITSFTNKFRQAKNKVKKYVESDPFYMYRYKFKLRLWSNGYGIGENTHLSIYIVIMKGEYDAILPWPFKKKVNISLIDQQEDSVKRENVTNQFIPGKNPECFARPTQEANSSGYGFPYFITHEKLQSRRYLVDDTLFLQVEVGP